MSARTPTPAPPAPPAPIISGILSGPAAPRRWQVTLPLPPRLLCPNGQGRVHWSKRSEAARAYGSDCYFIACAHKPTDLPLRTPVRLTLEFYCARRRDIPDGLYRPVDIDNAISSFKHGLDGLVGAGWIAGDDHKAVCGISVRLYRTKREHQGRRELVVTVEETV